MTGLLGEVPTRNKSWRQKQTHIGDYFRTISHLPTPGGKGTHGQYLYLGNIPTWKVSKTDKHGWGTLLYFKHSAGMKT
jgi:hypothetical protein